MEPQPAPAAEQVDLSVVVPLFNEADNVAVLHRRIVESLTGTGRSFEILLVDDGSNDGTFPLLAGIARRDSRVRVIKLRRNFGQTPAMQAGIDHCRGKVIVTLDGDLQNDPQDIPILVNRLEEGYDLVVGWRRDRKDHRLLRNFPSRVANRLIRWVSGVPIHDTGCSLKAYRAELIRNVPLYADLHRFIPAMSTMASARVTEVVVRHHPRLRGRSKYGLSRIWRVLLDLVAVKMLISSSRRPLHWFGIWSIPCVLGAIILATYEIYNLLLPTGDRTFVFLTVAFLLGCLGVSLLVTGLLGELIIRTEPSAHVSPMARLIHLAPALSPEKS